MTRQHSQALVPNPRELTVSGDGIEPIGPLERKRIPSPLSDAAIRKAKVPLHVGKHHDGRGLYLSSHRSGERPGFQEACSVQSRQGLGTQEI